MIIDADFAGGNVKVVKVTDNEAWLEPDLSDTSDKWFYFNFRVRGAAGKTVTFHMGGVPYGYVSPFGPSVSSDGEHYAFYPEKRKSMRSRSGTSSARTRMRNTSRFRSRTRRKDFTNLPRKTVSSRLNSRARSREESFPRFGSVKAKRRFCSPAGTTAASRLLRMCSRAC